MLGALLWLVAWPVIAQASAAPERTCTRCHDDTAAGPVMSILQSKHAVAADPRTPSADQFCTRCHGASTEHMKRPSAGAVRAGPDRMFGRHAGSSPSAVQSSSCIGCHQNEAGMHWIGSAHETAEISCASCHRLHTAADPVLATETQHEVCIDCHRQQRAELNRPSTHPILAGQMSCSDCHDAHGSRGPSLLTGATVNETCYRCHAEKRGPFLWEHAPVREDCGNCHRPHGSSHAALLTARSPWLCQQCHMEPMHPGNAYSGSGLAGATTPSGAQQMLGKACGNCHSQVHGSNHPSGVGQTR